MLAYQNALSFLFGSSLDSMSRCGDYELTAQYRPMILSLGNCETAEQVEETAQELKWMVEDLPLEAKDACYRLMTHTVEDAILADYRDAVTRLHGTWYDRYLLSLLEILEHPTYEEHTLDFTLFDGNRFALVDAESLAACSNAPRLRKMTHILRTALRRLPTDRMEAAIKHLATHLPAIVINRMQHTTHAEEPTTTILLRLALTLSSSPTQWLTNDSLADWVVGESREVKMAGRMKYESDPHADVFAWGSALLDVPQDMCPTKYFNLSYRI